MDNGKDPNYIFEGSAKLTKFSKYKLVQNNRGIYCVVPDDNSIQEFYDPYRVETSEGIKNISLDLYKDFMKIEDAESTKEMRGFFSPKYGSNLTEKHEKTFGKAIVDFANKYGLLGLENEIYKEDFINGNGRKSDDWYERAEVFYPSSKYENGITASFKEQGEPVYLIIDAFEKVYRHLKCWDAFERMDGSTDKRLQKKASLQLGETRMPDTKYEKELSSFKAKGCTQKLVYDRELKLWRILQEFETLYSVICFAHIESIVSQKTYIHICYECGQVYATKVKSAINLCSSCSSTKKVVKSRNNQKEMYKLFEEGKSYDEVVKLMTTRDNNVRVSTIVKIHNKFNLNRKDKD